MHRHVPAESRHLVWQRGGNELDLFHCRVPTEPTLYYEVMSGSDVSALAISTMDRCFFQTNMGIAQLLLQAGDVCFCGSWSLSIR